MKRSTRKYLKIAILISLLGCLLVVFINPKQPEIEPAEEAYDTIYGDKMLGIDAGVDEELSGYRNIMVYGIDNKHRSDIMMVFSINEETKNVKLFSIYRDTYLKLNDDARLNFGGIEYKYFKCNHGYFNFGMTNSLKTLNSQLDLNIHEAIAMEWGDIAEFVDMVGGIDVDVTEAMIPHMGKFLDSEDGELKPGQQILMNDKAVAYLRCRKDSDATVRSHRNEAVFVQLFRKAQAMSEEQRLSLFDKIVADVDTNMSRAVMTDTLSEIAGYNLEVSDGWPYDYSIEWHRTGSYYFYVPHTLESNVSALHEEIFGQKGYVPTEHVREISKEIEETDELE